MNTSHFTSNFWNYYIAGIVVLSFIGLLWLVLSQNKVKMPPKGEDVKTTGHNWDGIEEYNNPLPRWWFYLYILIWLFCIGYLYIYPGLGDYKGAVGWTSTNQYEKEMQDANAQFAPVYGKFANMPVEQVAADPQAQRFGKNLFDTYCIQCCGAVRPSKSSKPSPKAASASWRRGGRPWVRKA